MKNLKVIQIIKIYLNSFIDLMSRTLMNNPGPGSYNTQDKIYSIVRYNLM